MIGYAAHLRVYEPLGAFDDDERRTWTTYVDSGPPSRSVLMSMEHEAGLAAACAVPTNWCSTSIPVRRPRSASAARSP